MKALCKGGPQTNDRVSDLGSASCHSQILTPIQIPDDPRLSMSVQPLSEQSGEYFSGNCQRHLIRECIHNTHRVQIDTCTADQSTECEMVYTQFANSSSVGCLIKVHKLRGQSNSKIIVPRLQTERLIRPLSTLSVTSWLGCNVSQENYNPQAS